MDSASSAISSALEKLHLRSPQSQDALEPPSAEQLASLRQKYAEEGQEHVFTFCDSLSPASQAKLYHQLLSLDPARLTSISETVLQHPTNQSPLAIDHEPLPSESCASTLDASPELLEKWNDAGLKAIAEGEVAVLLMAGGQGTRLGSSAPKGCYDIGLPSGKSLFQLQAERLVKLQDLAAAKFGDRGKEVIIPWYIMTSGPTRKDTEDFLKSKNFFGLKVSNFTLIMAERGVDFFRLRM
jgi:UDP-N-acetylglucosamine/UDP-N-acetylgalactosamine diphosphorylase